MRTEQRPLVCTTWHGLRFPRLSVQPVNDIVDYNINYILPKEVLTIAKQQPSYLNHFTRFTCSLNKETTYIS